MGIPTIRLTRNDFAILTITIDAYIESLRLPDIYPEHSAYYAPLLLHLRAIFWSLVKQKWDGDFLMTEPQVIALDEAVQGFMRICERCKKDATGYPRTVAALTHYHQWLEKLKLPSIEQLS